MKQILFISLLFSMPTFADTSLKALEKRVEILENLVTRLDKTISKLEERDNPTNTAKWVCKATAFGDTFVAYGGSEAVAKNLAIAKCSKSNNEMHCRVTCDH
ncbi:MAG: hypothetical protein K9K67_12475 [Bacteriovoracaceae bacterium]|nr:hypothetical protein [Bacteriovoracaceae bacterium]